MAGMAGFVGIGYFLFMLFIMGLSTYVLILGARALKIYIDKNS